MKEIISQSDEMLHELLAYLSAIEELLQIKGSSEP